MKWRHTVCEVCRSLQAGRREGDKIRGGGGAWWLAESKHQTSSSLVSFRATVKSNEVTCPEQKGGSLWSEEKYTKKPFSSSNTNCSTCPNQLIIFTTYCPSSVRLLFKVVKTSRSVYMFNHVKKVEAASSLKNIVGIKSYNKSTLVSNDWMSLTLPQPTLPVLNLKN